MELGTFSVSLSVRDISKSLAFYQGLGFEALEGCGSVADKWLILKSDDVIIGLFQDMFEGNILTFNPTDARAIERHLVKLGVEPVTPTEGESGPTHCVINDPDGNVIMFDQH